MSEACIVCWVEDKVPVSNRSTTEIKEAYERAKSTLYLCEEHLRESSLPSQCTPETQTQRLVNVTCHIAKKASQAAYDKLLKDYPLIVQGSEVVAAKIQQLANLPVVTNGAKLIIENATIIANSEIVVEGSKLIVEDVEKLKVGARRMLHAGAKRVCEATAEGTMDDVRYYHEAENRVDSEDEECVLI
ncbi:hypothetical protein P167DRAFT_577882 [Morchella conica CCBAS932]|uniref:Uncharacterized protein n=1 Tax=Morchella conica CCBAS932 TaxID=1392247 RepID=A0A3N4KE62_9PEZI|nr:hypothetical protein P167DRAFT_577882 [Morchella conica CCBAS932]